MSTIDLTLAEEAYKECEDALTIRTGPFIDRLNKIEDQSSRRAMQITYASLRIQGPLSLMRPYGRSRTPEQALQSIRDWTDGVRLSSQGQPKTPFQHALADTIERFNIPMAPWVSLGEGLTALVNQDPVDDVATFLLRGRQLALPPANVFFRVLCSKKGTRRYHLAREIEIEELSHDPALFAYCVGSMADIFRELDHTSPPRSSLPRQLLERHGLDVDRLLEIRNANEPTQNFVNLMHDLTLFGWTLYESGVSKITQVARHLSPQAIHHLDRFLNHYKVVLQQMEKARFSPSVCDNVARNLEPRLVALPESAEPGNAG